MSLYALIQEENYAGFYIRLGAAFIFGCLGAFAMPPWHIWQGLVIGLSGFYLLLYACPNKKSAFLIGWLFGFGYFLCGLSWIGNALLIDGNAYAWAWPLAVAGLPFGLAFFFGIASVLIYLLCNLRQIVGYLGFIAILGLFEWLRGHIFTGFPWNLFGYALADQLSLLQTLSFSNVYYLSVLVTLWCTMPVCIVLARSKGLFVIVLGSSLLLGSYMYGTTRLQEKVPARKATYIHIAQPNIAQHEKWDRTKLYTNFRKHVEMSRPERMITAEDTVYIVWPESAFSSWMYSDPVVQNDIKIMLKQYSGQAYLLSGYLFQDPNTRSYTNSLIMIDQNGTMLNKYDKHHLVPFGEYIPFQDLIPLAPVTQFVGFERGAGPLKQSTPEGLKYAPLVCYEIIFPGKVSPAHLDFIVNVTNDAWYGESAGPYQHFAHAVFRGIETGLPVIRSANTGFSGVIDGYGRVLGQTELYQQQSLLINLPDKPAVSPVLISKKDHISVIVLLFFALLASARRKAD